MPTVPALRGDPASTDAVATEAPRPASRLFSDGRSPGSRIDAGPACLPEAGCFSGVLASGSPLTVAGAAAVSHRVPFSSSGWKNHQADLYAPSPAASKRCRQEDFPIVTAGFTLVLGGARSGKSRHAESLLEGCTPRLYVATAQAFDDEMRERIALHRAARKGWRTVEAPLDPGAALLAEPGTAALVDCLTLWLTNLMLGEHDLTTAFAALDEALEARTGETVLVGNEVGLGIVPDNALARRFRDEAGRLHQRLAARATAVLFMVAGLPMRVK